MRIGALSFLNRTNSPHTFSLAAWHSPHSLTWRWLLHWQSFRGDEKRTTWRLLWWSPNNLGVHASLLIPFIGRFWFQTQQPMWYRDMHQRLRDERDTERYRASIARHESKQRQHAAEIRGDAPLH